MQRNAAHFLVALLILPCACARPITADNGPAGSFDDLLADIVRRDWQTEGQWDSSSTRPPPEFIAQVLEGIELCPLDIDGDGLNEFVLSLNFSPGQKPINQTFYILRKVPGGWRLIGQVEGEPELALDADHVRGNKPLVTTWYNGGFQYTSTRYEFHSGHYMPVETSVWSPSEE